jgi:hypothetical protein
MSADKFFPYRDGRRRTTISVRQLIGSAEIAIVLFTQDDAVGEKPTRTEVLRLVREVAHQSGRNGLSPECGVDLDEGYENEYAPAARRAAATVRRLWPELDDADLRRFEELYAMPGVDL